MDKLEQLWASPWSNDFLRRQNLNVEFGPATSENTAALREHIARTLDDEPEPEPEAETMAHESSVNQQPQATAEKPYNPSIRINLKGLRETRGEGGANSHEPKEGTATET